jgi:hypothetical protein
MGVAWLSFFYVIYGVFDPQIPYGEVAGTDLSLANIPRGLLGLFFDQKFGLFFYSPLYVAAVAGAWIALRRAETRAFGLVLIATAAAFVGATTRYYMWWGGTSPPARFLVPVLPCLAPMVALAVARGRSPMARGLVGLALVLGGAVALAGVGWPAERFLMNDSRSQSQWLRALAVGPPLDVLLPTFIELDWESPLLQLLPWLGAGIAGGAAMWGLSRRREQRPVWLAVSGALVFLTAAAGATARPSMEIREEAARRGAAALVWRYDGDRSRGFDYSRLTRVPAGEALAGAPIVFDQAPTAPISLPPGAYEARIWFGGGLDYDGQFRVSAGQRVVFGLAEGRLRSPVTIPFDLLLFTDGLAVDSPDAALAGAVRQVEILPRRVMPRRDRTRVDVVSIDPIDDWPGGYVVYADRHSYPEGGVFWTRGTEPSSIFVATAGASRLSLTLFLGPNGGPVRLSVAGVEQTVQVAPNEPMVVESTIPDGLQLVPVAIQAPTTFRPFEVDPDSSDVRSLGCQVRVELR